ncbi:hypothetical protein ASD24_12570 [Paenibacillus sp. Root52]|nr:hypothetical protein ASD24_12570 [Paenibacillus sp. Root52]
MRENLRKCAKSGFGGISGITNCFLRNQSTYKLIIVKKVLWIKRRIEVTKIVFKSKFYYTEMLLQKWNYWKNLIISAIIYILKRDELINNTAIL